MQNQKLPKTSQLVALQALVQYGSFNTAARVLNLSQSSLTRSIQELESTVGIQLVERTARGSRLTADGLTFAKQALLYLEGLLRAVNSIDPKDANERRQIRFGVSPISAFSIMPQAMRYIVREFPSCRYHLDDAPIERNIEQLQNGFLDFAIGNLGTDISFSSYDVDPLFECPFYIACVKGHPLENCTSLGELREANWWVTGEHKVTERENATFRTMNMQRSLYTRSFHMGIPFVLENGYLSLLSTVQINRFRKELSVIPIKDFRPIGRYGIFRMKNVPLTEEAERLIAHLHYAADHFDWELSLV